MPVIVLCIFRYSNQLILTGNLEDKYYSHLTGEELTGLGQRDYHYAGRPYG